MGLIFLIGIPAQLISQEAKETPPVPIANKTTKVISVKYADVDALARVIRPIFRYGYGQPIKELRVLTVSGTPEEVAAAEEVIKRFDVPPPPTRDLELTAYLLVGEEQTTGAKVPADLDGVIKQLKALLPYSSFRLLDTLVVRCRDGRAGEVRGLSSAQANEDRTIYNLEFRSAQLQAQDSRRMIKVDGLKLGARIPVQVGSPTAHQFQYIDTGINTDIDVLEGQKVVVGKATVDKDNNAIFLVLSAKVMD